MKSFRSTDAKGKAERKGKKDEKEDLQEEGILPAGAYMIACKPVRRLFYQESTGYTVALYQTKETIPPQAVCGQEDGLVQFRAVGRNLPDIRELSVNMEGVWKNTPYGWQMEVENIEVFLPKSREGIAGYLSSGLIKGVGPVTAERIVDLFGEETFDVIRKEPEKLLEVKGITQERLKEIKASFEESSRIRELMAYLAPYKVTPNKVEKIQKQFGTRALEVLQENPYRLTEVPGMGFLTVDPVARRLHGLADNDPFRLKAAIRYVLKLAESEGHLYLDAGEVVQRCMILFSNLGDSVLAEEVKRAGNELVLKKDFLVADGSRIYFKAHLLEEKSVARDVRRLVEEGCGGMEVEGLLQKAQQEDRICLGEKQREAVRKAFRYPVSIITGGPGRGKTTVLKTILRIFKAVYPGKSTLLCAPTGRAARRMMESTGQTAMTIHKALSLSEEEWDTSGTEPISEELVVVDETTMVDMKLAAELFSRLKSGCRLILTGDGDQLPSVGPGNVFRELIDSGRIPVTVLEESYRQREGSLIIENAERINAGSTQLRFGKEFSFLHADSPQEAADTILRLYEKVAEQLGNKDAIQVLSPVKKQPFVGVEALNYMLRELANPDRGQKKMGSSSHIFRIGDKVMQVKNRGEISNGDIGLVEEIRLSEESEEEMTVCYADGRHQTYKEGDLELLCHAYAITVHKSQGSEYPVVILPVLPSFYKILKRNVLYTAITRASRAVYLVGSTAALVHGIHRNDVGRRNTKLAARIRSQSWREDLLPAA